MELLEGIMTRKSIRAYDTNRPVEEEKLRKIVEAGMNAPTAMEQHAWRILTIQNHDTMVKISSHSKWWQMLKNCPLAIVVMTDVSDTAGLDEEFQVVSAAAATENMLLAAHGLGLGGVWLGISQSDAGYESFRATLGIPKNLRVVSVMALGYPKVEPQPPENRFEDSKWIREHF